jgi:hypothetical protein
MIIKDKRGVKRTMKRRKRRIEDERGMKIMMEDERMNK